MPSPSYSACKPKLQANQDARPRRAHWCWTIVPESALTGVMCQAARMRCEHLERGPRCGWHGDKLGHSSKGGHYPKKCPDCLVEGAPKKGNEE
jgi:hypothetical protein